MTLRHLFLLCLLFGCYCISFSQQFETEGIIHSSEGGIMFPDKTVQKTAAQNTANALAGDLRGIGFLHIDGYSTDIDSGGFSNLIPIIDFELSCEPAVPGNPRSGAVFNNAKVTFNIGPWSPKIWIDHALGKFYPSLDVHLTSASHPFYFEYNFETIRIVAVTDKIVHLGNSKFSHLQTIEFYFEEITWTEKTGSAPVSTTYSIETGQ